MHGELVIQKEAEHRQAVAQSLKCNESSLQSTLAWHQSAGRTCVEVTTSPMTTALKTTRSMLRATISSLSTIALVYCNATQRNT